MLERTEQVACGGGDTRVGNLATSSDLVTPAAVRW